MLLSPDVLRLYAITDPDLLAGRDMPAEVEKAIKGGATIIQLREKNISDNLLTAKAEELLPVCHSYGVPLIINDNYLSALESGADGVHVGISDAPVAEIRRLAGKDFIIGATAKTVEQAKAAEAAGADYLGVGAVFPSPTKTNAIRITPGLLADICRSVSIPVVAIGGISYENADAVKGCGQSGIAVVSAVFGAADIYWSAERMRRKADEVCR